MVFSIIWIILSYFLGAIPFGVLFAKKICNLDPRELGSCNIGATNIARVCNKKLGLITLCFDILKGIIAMSIAMLITESNIVYTMVGIAVIVGHIFSCFTDFKGGKAVATYIGVFIPLVFWQTLFAVIICIFFIWRSGFVSVGSLTLVTILPVFLLITSRFEIIPFSLIVMCLIFWRHKDNIQRLIKGEEKNWR